MRVPRGAAAVAYVLLPAAGLTALGVYGTLLQPGAVPLQRSDVPRLPFPKSSLPSFPSPNFSSISANVTGPEEVKGSAEGGTVLVIPVNGGWHALALNAWCSLQRVTLGGRENLWFLALDHEAYALLSRRRLPVYMDPGIDVQVSGGKEWGSQAFNRLVCAKLSGVLHLLQRGLAVFLVDADVAFQTDPFRFEPRDYDLTWSWGGHLDPTAPTRPHAKAPPRCGTDYTPGRCYANTGFYHARPTPGAVAFLHRAEAACLAGRPTRFGDRDDQTYVNELLLQAEEDPAATAAPPCRMACFDPCRWTNGNTFFKYKIPWKSHQLAVSVHANFMTGADRKIRKLRAHGLWNVSCVPSGP